MNSLDKASGFQALLMAPQPEASVWLRWQDRTDVLAAIDASCLFVRLIVPIGSPRRSHDAQLAADLLRWNAEHLGVGSPCFSLDERDGAIYLGTALPLAELTPEAAAAALERTATASDEARTRLADAISFVD